MACIDAVTRFCHDLPDSERMVWHTCDVLLCDFAARVSSHASTAAVARSIAARSQLLVDTLHVSAALPALEQRVAAAASCGSVRREVDVSRDVASRVQARLTALGFTHKRSSSSSTTHSGATSNSADNGSSTSNRQQMAAARSHADLASSKLSAAETALRETAAHLRTLIRDILLSSVDEVLAEALALNWAPSHVGSERSGYAADLLILLEGSVMKIDSLAESLQLDLISGIFAHISQFLSV